MATVEGFRQRISEVGLDQLQVAPSTASEAKGTLARFRLAQRELCLIRRDIDLQIRSLRSDAVRLEQATAAAVGRGFPSPVRGGQARARAAAAKRAMQDELDREILPYKALQHSIDNMLLELDKSKLQLQEYIRQA